MATRWVAACDDSAWGVASSELEQDGCARRQPRRPIGCKAAFSAHFLLKFESGLALRCLYPMWLSRYWETIATVAQSPAYCFSQGLRLWAWKLGITIMLGWIVFDAHHLDDVRLLLERLASPGYHHVDTRVLQHVEDTTLSAKLGLDCG